MEKGDIALMEYIELVELTDNKATYRYYPEGGQEYGIVSLNRKTGERIHDKICPNSISMYAGHTWRRLEEYQATGEFPKRAQIAWY